ncbi:MAG: DinB family protein [Acidimicrobiales bacterium]
MTEAQSPRTDPPLVGDELATLTGFLDFLREAIVIKAAGVDDEALRRPMVPSGVCLLGIVKHLAYMERWWFAHVFTGLDVEFPWTDDDPDADWRVEPDDKSEVILDLYRTECDRSRAILAASEPEQLSAKPTRQGDAYSLRWIVTHMIEETGRHAGHADILREMIDGSTGE